MARPTPVLPEVGSTIVPPGPQPALLLSRFDHREPDPVLHRAAGIQVLELGQKRARNVAAQPVEAHDRRLSDELEDGGILAARHSPRKRIGLNRDARDSPRARTCPQRSRSPDDGSPRLTRRSMKPAPSADACTDRARRPGPCRTLSRRGMCALGPRLHTRARGGGARRIAPSSSTPARTAHRARRGQDVALREARARFAHLLTRKRGSRRRTRAVSWPRGERSAPRGLRVGSRPEDRRVGSSSTLRDAAGTTHDVFGASCMFESPDAESPFGIRLCVLQPG